VSRIHTSGEDEIHEEGVNERVCYSIHIIGNDKAACC
jgi:hypothetical protein